MSEIQNTLSEYDSQRQKFAKIKNSEVAAEVTFRKQYTESSSIANAFEWMSKKSGGLNEDRKDINSSKKLGI